MQSRHITSLLLAAAFAFAPALWAAPGAAAATPPGSAADNGSLPAVDLSYDGLHLAMIVERNGSPELLLANGSGGDRHAVTLPGHCAPDGVRWAPRWDELAVVTHCASPDADGARGAVWLLDVHADKPPRKLLNIKGYARDPEWTSNARRVVFLYKPNGQRRSVVAAISVSGGAAPQILTPQNLNVQEFHVSHWGTFLAYTATPAAARLSSMVPPALFTQKATVGAKPSLLFNPATAKGSLRDLRISLPRWNYFNGSLYFLGRSPESSAATGANLYLIGSAGGNPINMTAEKRIKPTWYRFHHRRLLAAQVVNGKTEVAVYRVHWTWVRQTALLFTLPGTISDGRAPSAFSMSWYAGRPHMAFFQRPQPDARPILRAGWIGTQPPPTVALTNEGHASD